MLSVIRPGHHQFLNAIAANGTDPRFPTENEVIAELNRLDANKDAINEIYNSGRNILDGNDQDGPQPLQVECATVDGFQGRGKAVVLMHFVTAFEDRMNTFGFVREQRRFCVALSRAQRYMFMVGNFSAWERRVKIWSGRIKMKPLYDMFKNEVNVRKMLYPRHRISEVLPHHV
ncbi:ATP-dependent helicase NAM7 [Coniosporium apollinis]|uniref:ATP-dependent helicase NAM7 n=2 Tax=Coniosporium TaxID=2810619 RepID=A0ABQ9P3Y9_9PEZI|nr:ATP-dependent helicase NAM7 [Cladosporium sp. JES 115]KAJ9669102.1 ATP-dependent helicase NAM7 [Coniosporium apollinis]